MTAVAISPDSKYIVSASKEGNIKIWNPETGVLISSLIGDEQGVTSLTVSADGKFIVSGCWDNTIKIWNFANE